MLKIFNFLIILIISHKTLYSQIILDWSYTYNGKGADLFYSVIETKSNDYIAVGRLFSEIYKSDSYVVIKFNNRGEIIWQKVSNNNLSECARSIIETNENDYIIAGRSGNSAYLFKMNTSGDIVWSNKLNTNPNIYNEIRAIDKLCDSNYVMVGASNHPDSSKIWVTIIDNNGNPLWSKNYSPGVADAVLVTKNNDIMVVCENKILKLNVKGELIWEKEISGKLHYQFYSIIITNDCNFLLTGSAEGCCYKDACLLKVDDKCNKIWEKVLGTDWEEVAIGSSETKDGGFIVIAKAPDKNGGSYKTWLLRTDSLGDTLWTRKYDISHHNNYNWPQSFLISNNNEIYVVGYIENQNSTYDRFISKFSNLLNSVNEIKVNYINDLTFLKIFPNPFNNSTKIQFNLIKRFLAKIIIYDIEGKIIITYRFDNDNIGIKEVLFDGKYLSSGIYFCKLIMDHKELTKKLLLIK